MIGSIVTVQNDRQYPHNHEHLKYMNYIKDLGGNLTPI